MPMSVSYGPAKPLTPAPGSLLSSTGGMQACYIKSPSPAVDDSRGTFTKGSPVRPMPGLCLVLLTGL